MTAPTHEELEVKIGEFLDTLPLDLTRGQAAMLFTRMLAFAEGLMAKEEEVKTDGRKRIMTEQERLNRSVARRAFLDAHPEKKEAMLATFARARAIRIARATLRKNGAGA